MTKTPQCIVVFLIDNSEQKVSDFEKMMANKKGTKVG